MTASRPIAQTIAMVLAILYGCVCLAGGIIGYVKAESMPSLLAGGGAGILLIVCGAVVLARPLWGLLGAAVISIALLAKFAPTVVHAQSGQSMREGQLLTAAIMSIGGVLVLLACAAAMSRRAGC